MELLEETAGNNFFLLLVMQNYFTVTKVFFFPLTLG